MTKKKSLNLEESATQISTGYQPKSLPYKISEIHGNRVLSVPKDYSNTALDYDSRH